MAESFDDTKKWRRSSFCANDACVEVADTGDLVLVRDSKDTSQPFLSFDRATWAEFVAEVRRGRFPSL